MIQSNKQKRLSYVRNAHLRLQEMNLRFKRTGGCRLAMKLKLFVILTLFSVIVFATGERTATLKYIEKYKGMAIREMKEYGIPVSITLAQGILESNSGTSYLATKANNHFGIKCHHGWEGRKIYKDDDKKNECFRAYKSADESFRDHSLFLTTRSHYNFLFEKDPTDYKAWAYGLKKAGYATNLKYPQLLIKIIEENDLQKYDLQDLEDIELDNSVLHILESANQVNYIIAPEGSTFESIAEKMQLRVRELLRYNELQYDDKLEVGQIIYLYPKRKKAAEEFKKYVVRKDDNMYSISQKFAIRLEKLYQHNNMKVGEQPKVGQVLKLR